MQDNFDLKGYLRHGNKLLNEGIGGYIDLKPLNRLNEDESVQFKKGDTVKIKDGQQFGDNPYMGVGEERFEDLKDQELEVTGIDDNGQTIWINDVDSLPASYLELVGEMNELGNTGTGPAIANEAFDFNDFQDTDLEGSGVEMAIDNLIEEYDRIIKSNVPEKLQSSARIAVKKLWLEKIKNWRA